MSDEPPPMLDGAPAASAYGKCLWKMPMENACGKRAGLQDDQVDPRDRILWQSGVDLMTQREKKPFIALRVSLTRRHMLLGLAAIAPAAGLMGSMPARADTDSGTFLKISRIITGNDSLSADVAERIQKLLADRTDGFLTKLDDLSTAMDATGGGRDQMLEALDNDRVGFALSIARPWYLGYVGSPSDFVLKDDAAFATFLEAQSWEKIIDEVPRPTYPGKSAGWWDVAPPGVKAPAMPDDIKSWTFHPGGPLQIMTPDPEWKSYATADHASIEDARRAKPAVGGDSDGN